MKGSILTQNKLKNKNINKNINNNMIGYAKNGLLIKPMFTKYPEHPFDTIEWELRNASISNEKGDIIFEANEVEFPKNWSQMATNVVASKYFTGTINTKEREKSVKTLIERVAKSIANWGKKDGYFEDNNSAKTFYRELVSLLVNQKASFNSPVWFNCGVEKNSNQFSACFINSVEDTMESILNLVKTEGMLFKWGSGTGTNLSVLRSSKEGLAGGGTASGPVSFMKGYDAFAGVIKSGGKTRRAAKMVILNVDHPDIYEFIHCKAEEEKKAHALINQGYDSSFNGEAYNSIAFQNANHSVRISDDFMKAASQDKEWYTKNIINNEIHDTYRAKTLLMDIAKSAYICGDPGLQFDTTINNWHTCPHSSKIEASNPCSEYMFVNDSACNLASINLMKFRNEDASFDFDGFIYAVSIMIIAQEILVEHADYPTKKIEKNSIDFRPLGLGYANLGALLMAHGFSYDSDEGRNYAALITALMTGQAYKTSSMIAKNKKPFKHFHENKKPMLRVIKQHQNALNNIKLEKIKNKIDYKETKTIFDKTKKIWTDTYELGTKYGYKNAQTSVLAPTGTIAFMMDCDTTGIEPDIALVKYKKLVGGGLLKIVNKTISMALKKLTYTQEQINNIIKYLDEHSSLEGCPEIKTKDLSVFDCAFKPSGGTRSIHYLGHIKMMEAVQPFLSGAISKTINMPNNITDEEIYLAFIEAWKRGLKSIAIYRDGSKLIQPLNTDNKNKKKDNMTENITIQHMQIQRKRLPNERQSITHKFSVGGHEGYITVGMYKDGKPGEIFVVMAKEGSVVSGLMDSFATAISIAIQYGVPLEILANKFMHTRFEPSGWTNNKEIPIAKSIMDYIFRWLSLKFLNKNPILEEESKQQQIEQENNEEQTNKLFLHYPKYPKNNVDYFEKTGFENQSDSMPCVTCGSIMVRNGSCYRCLNCGSTSGCS